MLIRLGFGSEDTASSLPITLFLYVCGTLNVFYPWGARRWVG